MFWEVLSETGTFLAGLAALLGVSLASKKSIDWFTKESNNINTPKANIQINDAIGWSF